MALRCARVSNKRLLEHFEDPFRSSLCIKLCLTIRQAPCTGLPFEITQTRYCTTKEVSTTTSRQNRQSRRSRQNRQDRRRHVRFLRIEPCHPIVRTNNLNQHLVWICTELWAPRVLVRPRYCRHGPFSYTVPFGSCFSPRPSCPTKSLVPSLPHHCLDHQSIGCAKVALVIIRGMSG